MAQGNYCLIFYHKHFVTKNCNSMGVGDKPLLCTEGKKVNRKK